MTQYNFRLHCRLIQVFCNLPAARIATSSCHKNEGQHQFPKPRGNIFSTLQKTAFATFLTLQDRIQLSLGYLELNFGMAYENLYPTYANEHFQLLSGPGQSFIIDVSRNKVLFCFFRQLPSFRRFFMGHSLNFATITL